MLDRMHSLKWKNRVKRERSDREWRREYSRKMQIENEEKAERLRDMISRV